MRVTTIITTINRPGFAHVLHRSPLPSPWNAPPITQDDKLYFVGYEFNDILMIFVIFFVLFIIKPLHKTYKEKQKLHIWLFKKGSMLFFKKKQADVV